MYCFLLKIICILNSVFWSFPGAKLCEAYYKVWGKCQEIYEKLFRLRLAVFTEELWASRLECAKS